MTIAKKYEDVVVERDAALDREAEVGRLYDSLVNRSNRERDASEKREAALREELATIYSDREAEKKMKAKARDQRDVQTVRACELQQRLTVAEQLLRETLPHLRFCKGMGRKFSEKLDGLDLRIEAVLKPASGCEHSFHYFGDYPRRRCNNCNALEVVAEGEGS